MRNASGKPLLAQLIGQQWVKERELENEFYLEYKGYREHLYQALLAHNGETTERFPGTRGRLVRLAQKILDRCLFVFFCEDMGQTLGFPPQLLRNFLMHESNDDYYDPNGSNIWGRLVRLFQAMNDGSAFGPNKLNQFNGGLFASDPDLEKLDVPNRVFCQQGQGQNEASLYSHPLTLLYLSASYNYASGWAEGVTRPPLAEADPQDEISGSPKRDPSRSLGLYTLGRIFEQSITELEILEAEVDGRPSVNKESKRKREGVYYTPEWVIDRIVDEALGQRLADIKTQCGWPTDGFPDQNAIDTYREQLNKITIVDPACGSGAFLITALRYLIDEWNTLREIEIDAALDAISEAERQKQGGIAVARKKIHDARQVRDDPTLIRDILRENLYGVDINAASVEITKLALWLHTARGDKPLSGLDDNIRDGNSLIGPDFYKGLVPYDEEEQERINAFDWRVAYPDIFNRGGFDVVLGNPPYVKLQNFRKVHADMADFLKTDRAGNLTYESTQTGNFDLYLPFIEKGIQLLNEEGRLGYIAPSTWIMNEYGAGLRQFIERGRQLYGWIDFQSFQIFDEATTYTALQFYSCSRNDAVKVAVAGNGVVPEHPWAGNDARLPYEKLGFGGRWLVATGQDRELIDKLYENSLRLEDPVITKNIFVGIQTSADAVFHLTKLAQGRYLCAPRGKDAVPYEVEIEDDLMKPLVSGAEAKRYIEPVTDTNLLFPYIGSEDGATLISEETFRADFPKAWKYVQSYEDLLRRREATLDSEGKIKLDADGKPVRAPFNNNQWYRFGRHQNLNKQEIQKLVIPRLVTTVSCSVDVGGTVYLDNVDVGGVELADGMSPYYIAGVLNAPVAGFVFRRISKPFRGDFRSANKQFIAPLPIPRANEEQKRDIAVRAEALQELHTRRRDLIAAIGRRTKTLRFRNKPETWLIPEIVPIRDLELEAPARLETEIKRAWAEDRYNQDLAIRYATISSQLMPGVTMDAEFSDGELKFLINGTPVIERIFLNDAEGTFILAQWKLLASTFSVTEKTDGKKLCNALRKIGETPNEALVDQLIEQQQALSKTENEISRAEAEMNAAIYDLYELTNEEIKIVERG